MYYKGGGIYDGEWINDERCGLGVFTLKEYMTVWGTAFDGICANKGLLISSTEYTGEWKNDSRCGQGILEEYNGYGDRLTYKGEFKKNVRYGFGEEIHKTLRTGIEVYKYSGDYRCDVRHGNGTLTFDGHIYKGQFKMNLRHGKGTFTYSDGKVYRGIWHNDKEQVGTIIYPDGSKYKGRVRDGKKVGQGVLYNAGGKIVKEGTFANDIFEADLESSE